MLISTTAGALRADGYMPPPRHRAFPLTAFERGRRLLADGRRFASIRQLFTTSDTTAPRYEAGEATFRRGRRAKTYHLSTLRARRVRIFG